jgi:hypothetical protein
MSNMVAAHVPPAAKARALGMSFTGFHTGVAVSLNLGRKGAGVTCTICVHFNRSAVGSNKGRGLCVCVCY